AKATHLLLEHLSAFRVIAKPVEARTRGRQQHHAVRTCGLVPASISFRHRRRVDDPHCALERTPYASARLADRDDGTTARCQRVAQIAEVAAFVPAANDGDHAAIEAFNRTTCSLGIRSAA